MSIGKVPVSATTESYRACMLTQPSGVFPETKFRPLGMLASQVFTRARDSLIFANAHLKRGRGSPKNFKGEHLKLGLKFSLCAPIILGLVGVTSRNFSTRRAATHEAYVIMGVQLLEGLPQCPNKIWDGKNVQNSARRDFSQLANKGHCLCLF